METIIKHYSVSDIRKAEGMRGTEIVDACGNLFEVVHIRLFCEHVADVCEAEAVNVFGAYDEAASFAAKMNDKAVRSGVNSCISHVYVVKSVNVGHLD